MSPGEREYINLADLGFIGPIVCAYYGAMGGVFAGASGMVTRKPIIGAGVGIMAGLSAVVLLSGRIDLELELGIVIVGTTIACGLSGASWGKIGQFIDWWWNYDCGQKKGLEKKAELQE